MMCRKAFGSQKREGWQRKSFAAFKKEYNLEGVHFKSLPVRMLCVQTFEVLHRRAETKR